VLPAALAVCQREHFDGAAFLIALAWASRYPRASRARPWAGDRARLPQPGTQGPFGAAAAAGKLYGFDEERLTNALGIAGSSSAACSSSRGAAATPSVFILDAPASSVWRAPCSRGRGCGGPTTVLEGRYGYFNALDAPRMERLVEGLGTEWAIEPPSLKSYATT